MTYQWVTKDGYTVWAKEQGGDGDGNGYGEGVGISGMQWQRAVGGEYDGQQVQARAEGQTRRGSGGRCVCSDKLGHVDSSVEVHSVSDLH